MATHPLFRRALIAATSVASAVALVALVSDAAPAAVARNRSEPVAPANALKRWAATMGGGNQAQNLTRDGAIQNARNYDLVVGLPATMGQYVPAMRSAHPGIRLITYLNGAYAMASQGSKYPAGWYSHDAKGNKVTSTQYRNYLMDVSNKGWVQSRVDECVGDINAWHFDGCYLDMLGGASLDRGYTSAPPINPATGKMWTASDFIAATSSLAAIVKRAVPTGFIVANGLSKGDLYFDPAAGPTSKLLDGIDGGNAQGWIRGTSQGVDRTRPVASWLNDVNMLVDAGARGRSVMTMTKIWGPKASADQKAAVHRYALASFLLGTNGSQYFFFSDTGGEAALAPDYAYDHVNVGSAQGAFRKLGNGAYLRRFTGGVAVVNPTSSSVTVSLGGSYRSLDGVVTADSVTLPPISGDVYVPA